MSTMKRKGIIQSDSESDVADTKPAAKRPSLGEGRAPAKKPNYLESSEEEEEFKPPPKAKGKGSKKDDMVSTLLYYTVDWKANARSADGFGRE